MIFDESYEEQLMPGDELEDPELFTEACLVDDIMHMPTAQRKAFLVSEQCQALLEKGIISKRTHVGLSKMDDMTRRTKMAVYMLARQKNDPLWKKFVKGRSMANQAEAEMYKRYQSKGKLLARNAQKSYMKITPVATTMF